MAYPALTDLATFVLVLAVGIQAVYLFSRALRLHPQKLVIADKKTQIILVFLVFAAAFVGAFAIYGFYDRVWVRATLTADPLYVLRDLIAIAILLLPAAVAFRASKQGLADVAITRKGVGRSLALGALTSAILILIIGVLSPYLGGGFAGFSEATIFLLLSYVVIGVGEEIVFRGYIQTRLVNGYGSALGLGVASVLYAAYNFPLGYFCFGGDMSLAAVYAAWRFSTGLLYGYVFHRSQNIVSSVIVHIFLVWGGLLFSLYL